MNTTARFHRGMTALSLLLAAGLMVVSVLLQPAFPPDAAQRLAAIEDGGPSATVSALTFAFAQLPFILAMLGVAQLLRARSPIMAILTAGFGVLGGFGHAIFGGISMTALAMAGDPENHEIYGTLMTQVEAGPAVVFMAMGLLGTVLGILFLAIGLWRAHAGPRWVPFVLAAFLVVEFAGTSISEEASTFSALLYLTAFTTLAAVVWKSPLQCWAAGAAPADAGTGPLLGASAAGTAPAAG